MYRIGVTNDSGDESTKLEEQVEACKQKMNSTAWKSYSKRQKALLLWGKIFEAEEAYSND